MEHNANIIATHADDYANMWAPHQNNYYGMNYWIEKNLTVTNWFSHF